MMQFIDVCHARCRSISAFVSGAIVSAGLVLCGGVPVGAVQQVDFRITDAMGESEAGVDSSANRAALNVRLDYLGSFRVAQHGEIILSEIFDGIRPLYPLNDSLESLYGRAAPPPYQERVVGSYNNAALGLRTTMLGDAQIIGRSYWFIDAPEISPERIDNREIVAYDTLAYYYGGNTMKRRMITQIDGSWQLPLGPVSVGVGENLLTRHYDNVSIVGNLSTFTDSVAQSVFTAERELFSDFSLVYPSPLGIDIGASARLKHNLSGYARDNMYRYEASLVGSHSLPTTNKINWTLAGRWYNMKHPRFEVGEGEPDYYAVMYHPYLRAQLRDVYTLGWGFFLKGFVMLDMGKSYFKDRYEFSIRKAWQSESSVEAGYFAALRGLDPMQGTYFRSVVRPVERFAVSANIKGTWELQANSYFSPAADTTAEPLETIKKEFNFNMVTGQLEGTFAIVKDVEIVLGGDYRKNLYPEISRNDDKNSGAKRYPARLGGYLGLRANLR